MDAYSAAYAETIDALKALWTTQQARLDILAPFRGETITVDCRVPGVVDVPRRYAAACHAFIDKRARSAAAAPAPGKSPADPRAAAAAVAAAMEMATWGLEPPALRVTGPPQTHDVDSLVASLITGACPAQRVDLSNCNLGPDDVPAIAMLLAKNLPQLLSLNLAGNPFGSEGVAILVNEGLLRNDNLRALDLSDCRFSRTGAAALRRALLRPGCALEWLDVSGNLLGPSGAAEIAAGIASTTCPLRHLAIANSNLGDDGAAALQKEGFLREGGNTSVVALHATGNRISELAFEELMACPAANVKRSRRAAAASSSSAASDDDRQRATALATSQRRREQQAAMERAVLALVDDLALLRSGAAPGAPAAGAAAASA